MSTDEGWELLYDGCAVAEAAVTLNFFIAPWQTVDYTELPAIGRFEGDRFDPPSWQPRVSTAALRHARSDDTFWAARRVAAFTDDMIRAVVRTGKYSDPAAEALLADVLIKRRQKIAAAYLHRDQSARRFCARRRWAIELHATPPSPPASPRRRRVGIASSGRCSTTRPATRARLRPAATSPQTTMAAPGLLPHDAGAFVRIRVTAGRSRVGAAGRRVSSGGRHQGGARRAGQTSSNGSQRAHHAVHQINRPPHRPARLDRSSRSRRAST